MKPLRLLLLATAILIPFTLHAVTPDEQAVLARAAIKAPWLPGGMLVLKRDGKPTRMTFESFADRIGKPGTTHIAERIHDPLVQAGQDHRQLIVPAHPLIPAG